MPKEKCENCKGGGYVVIGTNTATCKRCKGNGKVSSNTITNYFD